MSFSPDGTRLAGGFLNGTVRVWNLVRKSAPRILRGHKGVVAGLSFSPDGSLLASGSWDTTVRLWDLARGSARQVLRGHDDAVSSVDFSPDGARLITGSWDRTARVWDLSGRPTHQSPKQEEKVVAVRFFPDGKGVALALSDGTVRAWDVARWEHLWTTQARGDLSAIAAGALEFPFRALVLGKETVIECAVTGRPVAWFPAALDPIVTHPSGRTWAGAVGSHVYIITLEGECDGMTRLSDAVARQV
ncbi:WD40 repeat domain-containing protein [Planctomycetota bacterium]